MKIAWLTPFSPPSAIGVYSRLVTDELSRHCAVEIWAPPGDTYPTALPLHFLPQLQADPTALDSYTHVIYNMGNHMPYHREIYETLRMRPGIVVLHDIVMHHFFAGYHHEHRRDPMGYRHELAQIYGRQAGEDLHQRLSRGEALWETQEVLRYPLFEPCLSNARAVVTHSHFHAAAARLHTASLVESIPLALAMDMEEARAAEARPRAARHDGRLQMVSFGMIGPNKRVHQVIEVLGSNKHLARRVQYTVLGRIGPEPYRLKLEELVARHGLYDTVSFLGYQPTAVLYDLIRAADICVNLRFPPTEGGSASLNDALYFGRPTIVTNLGCYQDVPDDCVVKIAPEREEAELAAALARLLDSADLRARLGRRAKEYADVRLTPAAYARDLLSFIERADRFAPRLNLLDTVIRELNAMEVMAGSPAFQQVAQHMARIWPE